MLKMCNKFIFLPLLLCTTLLSGCSPLRISNQTLYQIAPTLPENSNTTHPARLSLLVSAPLASATYDTDKMIYVTSPYKIGYFTKNRWSAEPAIMLQPLMMESLQNTHYFSVVTSAPFSGYTDLRLDTTLLTLQQNFITNPSQIEMVIDARLVSSATQQVIGGQRFTIITPAPGNNPAAGVQATNEATTTFLKQLNIFVLKYAHG